MEYIIYTKDDNKKYKFKGEYEVVNNRFKLTFNLPINASSINIVLNLPVGYTINLIQASKGRDFVYYLKNTNKYKDKDILKTNSIVVLGGRFEKNSEYTLSFNLSGNNELLLKYINELIPVTDELFRTKRMLCALSEENATLQNCYNSIISSTTYLYKEHDMMFNALEDQTTIINDLKNRLAEYEGVEE